MKIHPFLRALDLIASFVLAVQGGSAAAAHGLDLLGILTVALISAVGGIVLRDVLIGAQPSEALRNSVMIAIALAGGLLAFLAFQLVNGVPESLLLGIDAIGLSLLAVAGTEKALEYGLKGPVAILMGGVTGVGGGTMRDILLTQIPAVLRVDFIASSALIGGAVLVVARHCGLRPAHAAVLGGVTCGTLRLLSALLHWHLPVAKLG